MARLNRDGLDEQWWDPYQSPEQDPQGTTDPMADQLSGIFDPGRVSAQSYAEDDPQGGDPAPAPAPTPAPTPAPAPSPTPAPAPDTSTGGGSGYSFNPNTAGIDTRVDASGNPSALFRGWRWDPATFRYVQDAGQNQTSDWLYDYSNLKGDLSSKTLLPLANFLAYGSDKNASGFYSDAYSKDPGYWYKRALGMGGSGADAAKYGPWAGGDPNAERAGAAATALQGPNVKGTTPGGSNVHDSLTDLLLRIMGGVANRQDPNSGLRSSMLSKFNSLMDEYGRPVDENDPIIRSNAEAYHGVQARKLNDYRERMAERAHAEGVPTGAFDAALGNAEMSAGRDEAQFTTGLMGNERQSRRSALANILSQSGAYLSDQDRMALQDKISTIDEALRSEGIDNAFELGTGSLENQKTQTSNQNTQFYDELANRISGNANSLDSLLLSLLLGH